MLTAVFVRVCNCAVCLLFWVTNCYATRTHTLSHPNTSKILTVAILL